MTVKVKGIHLWMKELRNLSDFEWEVSVEGRVTFGASGADERRTVAVLKAIWPFHFVFSMEAVARSRMSVEEGHCYYGCIDEGA